MTTYNSYEAAKIANSTPNDGEWWMVATEAGDIRVMRYWLRDGDEDAVWNVYKDESMSVLPAPGVTPMYKMDKLPENQAALETKEPKRTKVEYVKVELTRKEFACELIDGNSLYTPDERVELYFDEFSGKMKGKNSKGLSWDVVIDQGTYLRRIETPIEWWEDASEFINQTDDDNCSSIMEGKLHVNATLTQDQWCDFARILLEQGE